jgi:hypothetical protein
MPIFTIEAPDGRKIKVEAETQELALRGAEEYAAANPIRSAADMQKGLQSGELRFSALSPDEQLRIARAEGSTLDNVGRQLSKGVPFIGAWGDEISARIRSGARALPVVGDYVGGSRAGTYEDRVADNLAYERARDKAFESDNPITSLGTSVAGGVAGTIAALPYVMGSGAAGAAGRAMLGVGAKTLPGAVGRGAVAGTLQGAAAGAGGAEDGFVNRGAGALTGGAIGGAIGGVAPLAFEGVRRARSGLINWMSPRAKDSLSELSPAARRYVRESLADPDIVARQAEELRKFGPSAMLADVSPEWRTLARVGASRPGLREMVINKITGRDAAKNQRLGADLNRALGPAEDPVTATQNILNTRADKDAINYTAAKRNAPPVDIKSTIDMIDDKLKSAEGMEHKALTNLRSMLIEKREFPVFNPDGSPAMMAGPAIRSQTAPKASTAGPVDLHTFIKNAGGLVDETGDLKSLGLGRLVNNRSGITLDRAREMAAEQGYLGANIDDAMANTYINDLLDALSAGRKVFSVYDDERVLGQLGGKLRGPAGGWLPGDPVPRTELREVAKDRVQNLHNIRQEIDMTLGGKSPGLGVPAAALEGRDAAVKSVRSALDTALKKQVPGFADADAVSSALAKRADALKMGTTVFNSGKEAVSPTRFSSIYDEMVPGERAALAKGARAELDRVVGTSENDPIALKRLLRGEGDWNRAKLRTVFGQGGADDALGAVDREVAFRNTFDRVTGNSETAPTTIFSKRLQAMEGGPLTNVPDDMTLMGAVSSAAGKIKTVLSGAIGKEKANRFASELAKSAIATGVERDALIDALQKAGAQQKVISRVLDVATRGGLIASREAPAYAKESPQKK